MGDDVASWQRQMYLVLAAYRESESADVDSLDRVGFTLDASEGAADVPFTAVVVASSEHKRTGMIGRTFSELKADAMLFVESTPTTAAFHNRGVEIPLLVVCFDATGSVVDRIRLEANDAQPVQPKAPYMYALELPADSWLVAEDAKLRLCPVPTAQEESPEG